MSYRMSLDDTMIICRGGGGIDTGVLNPDVFAVTRVRTYRDWT